MSEERFREVFRRITAETPDAPAFSDLETHRAKPATPVRLKPWMAAVGAAVLVLVVVGAFGLLGGGGPDLAAPDEGTIDYVKLEYSATVNPVCEGGEIIDNGGFDEATIEIWGPNSDDLTLMVATFPDGSMERTITEGDPFDPERAWGIDPAVFEEETGFRSVQCSNASSDGIETFGFLNPPYRPGFVPITFLGPPPGYETWEEALDYDMTLSEFNGNAVTRLSRTESLSPDGEYRIDFYVSLDEPNQLLGLRYEWNKPDQGSLSTQLAVTDLKSIEANSVSFSTGGLFFIGKPGVEILEKGEIPADCRVTIPSQAFTPPDTHPPRPSDSDLVWFGKDELWTALSTDGTYDPRKSVWWSVNFPGGSVEPEPELKVRYTLLNSPRSLTFETTAATNAHTDADGWFIIAGLDTRYAGCWEVTAIYKGASLTYIYYNPDGADPEPVVPDVIGMTVERAGNVLHDAGYQASFHDSANPTYEVCAQELGAGLEVDPGAIIGMRTAPPGRCDELMDASLNPNSLYDTYLDQFGNVWYETSCPEADVLITGGADGLPRLGQTTKERVEQTILVEEVQAELAEADFFLGNRGVSALSAVPRNGEVWDRDENNDVVVTHVADYMIEAIITDESACPSAPNVWNGIPVAYIKIDTN